MTHFFSLITASILSLGSLFAPHPTILSGFSEPFLSLRLATTSLTNGYYLQTTGTTNVWAPVAAGVVAKTCTGTDKFSAVDSSGNFTCTTDLTGGGGAGSGTVSTSTGLVNGQVDFSTSASTIGNDSNFVWDNSAKRLGIATATPRMSIGVGGSVLADAFYAASTTATSTFNQIQVGPAAYKDNAVDVNCLRTYASSISDGGCVNIRDNTGANLAANLTIYSSAGAGSLNRRLSVVNDNQLYDQELVTFQSYSNARTTLGLIGSTTAQGVLKINVNGQSAGANGSGISVDIQSGTTTAAQQGIFITSTVGGTTGKLIQLRNNMLAFGGVNSQVNVFDVTGDAKVGISSSTPWAKLSINPVAQDGTAPFFSVGSTSQTNFIIDQFGNVGIGSTSPASLLSINGVANFRAATTSFSSTGGIDLTAGCFSIRGTCVTGGGGATSPAGTAGQLQYNASGAFGAVSTTTLTVSGPFSTTAGLGTLVGGSNATITYYGLATTSALTAGQVLMSNGGAGVSSVATTSVSGGTGISLSANAGALIGGSNLTITNSGVISVSCPGGFLTCSGTNPASFTLGTLGLANGGTATTTFYNGGIVYSDGVTLTQPTGSGNSQLTWDNTNGRFGVGTSSPMSTLAIESNGATGLNVCNGAGNPCLRLGFVAAGNQAGTFGTETNAGFFLRTNGVNRVAISNSGLVGIATTTPQWPLQIFSGTSPQLTLSSGTTADHWSFRSINNNLYISTSSPSSFATSTANALTIDTNGVVTFGNRIATCVALTGDIGLCDGNDASAAGGSAAIATSTNETSGQLAYWSTTSGTPAKLNSVATSSLTVTGPFSTSGMGALVGGSSPTITYYGIATSSALTAGQLLMSNGAGNVSSVATSSVSCSNGLSCTAFNALTASTLGLASIAANSVLANSTGASAVPTAVATSSLYTWSPAFTAGSNLLQNIVEKSFTYATSSWTGSTTIPLEQSILPKTILGVRCKTFTGTSGAGSAGGTLNVQFGNGTASTTMINASSTNNFNGFNSAVTAADNWMVEVGTPASSPRILNCTYEYKI